MLDVMGGGKGEKSMMMVAGKTFPRLGKLILRPALAFPWPDRVDRRPDRTELASSHGIGSRLAEH